VTRVGVTGATGFIGRRAVAALRASGTRVITIGRRDADRSWSPPEASDVSLNDIDVLVHLASFIPPGHGAEHARRCVEVNALGTLGLLEAAKRDGVAHLVHTSSGNVYADPSGPTGESSPAFPDRHAPYYLGSKLLADVWVSHAARTGLGTTILRPSAVYGPGMSGGVVRIFVDRLRAGRAVTLADGGRFRSDLVFVDDVVRAIVAAVEQRPPGIVNVGSGTTSSVAEVAGHLGELLGTPSAHIVREPDADGAAPGFAPLDIDRLNQLVGEAPTPLRRGLERMLAEEGQP